MNETNHAARTESTRERLAEIPAVVYHAFESFLAVPTVVVGAFLLLSIASSSLDRNGPGWLEPL